MNQHALMCSGSQRLFQSSSSRWWSPFARLFASGDRRQGRQCGVVGFTLGGYAAAMLLSCTCAAQDVDKEGWRQSSVRIVRIESISENGRRFAGSGVIVGQDVVATNCHVTRIAHLVKVYTRQAVLRATLQHSDPSRDLCVLVVPGIEPLGIDEMSPAQRAPGDAVYALGFSHGRGLIANAGRIVAVFSMHGAGVIQGDAQFSHGMSGGGLFDTRGRLVGVLTFFRTSEDAPTSYFSIPSEWIASIRRQPAVDIAPHAGTPFWAEPIERQPRFLQAGALEAAGHWQDMLRVTRDWVQADAADPNGWIMLGRAARAAGDLEGMHQALSGMGQLLLGQVTSAKGN